MNLLLGQQDLMVVFLWIVPCVFGVACATTYVLAHHGGRLQVLDHPNERSLHSTPIPRTGGLAIWTGVLAGTGLAVMLLETGSELVWIVGAALGIGVVSFIDDRFGVSVGSRLVTHLLAGAILLAGGFGLESISLPGAEVGLVRAAGWLLSLLFVTWMINLYNFMDGMDGFAAGMAVIGFGTFAFLGSIASQPVFVVLNLTAAAAAGGFLIYNFPPARIFMGDTGSSTIGFLAAASILWAARDNIFPLWVGILIFSPFIGDATVTLVRRLVRGDRIWLPHKTHYYQRLVQLGWGHRKTALTGYGLMSLCSVSAVITIYLPVVLQWGLLIAWLACYAGIIICVKRIERRAQACDIAPVANTRKREQGEEG